jgi:cell wall-associated NlpC family hydrolase
MPLTSTQREHIVKVAESWYHTPYRGWSCLKGAGVDCGQFLKGVYAEAGFLPGDIPLPKNYSLQVSQHRKDTEYIDTVARYMREIPEAEVLPGDVVIYKLGLAFAHGAIVVNWPEHIIHALERYGVTAGHGTNLKFGRLEKKFFTLREEFLPEDGK